MTNARAAYIPPGKRAEYSLDADHPTGKHKARVFRAALGIGAADADWLTARILDAICVANAFDEATTPFGHRYAVESPLTTDVGTATVRTTWLVRHHESFPRLTFCYIP